MANNIKWLRNLNKNEVGGVIFGCTNATMRECLSKQLFGLPSKHFLYVKNIEPGMPLFLFNYSDRTLHGIYEAASSGKVNIDPYAWTGDGSDRTRYPAQVQVCLRKQCQPVPECHFKPIIIDNYYNQTHFWFELDLSQTSRLISQFLLSVTQTSSVPRKSPKITTVMNWVPVKKEEENEASQPPSLAHDFTGSNGPISTSSTLDESVWLDEDHQLMDKSCNQNPEFSESEKDLIFMKLREISHSSEFSDSNMGRVVEFGPSDVVVCESELHIEDPMTLKRSSDGNLLNIPDYPAVIEQLSRELKELRAFKEEHTQKAKTMEKKLAEAKLEISRLEKEHMRSESISNTSSRPSQDEKQLELHDELLSNTNESILLVGGFDGNSWSSALDSFLPSHDILRSLKPMSYVRSFASIAKFNGELYVFGGGNGSIWYNAVESYNPVQNEWTMRPSLNKEKGSLAGAAVNDKIFAIGGGNQFECFSDVEMFDPCVCRWISARSMLNKRFALAAAELNGALYAVGGYNGNDYLKSAERFDPREHSWRRVGNMNKERGGHSLVVMNEKLYAIGGHDGITMIPNVEIYDPRLGTWMAGEPMNEGRGYLAAAAVKDSIYVIGGIDANEGIVEEIECYNERRGWEVMPLSAVGRRSFASAIVL